MPCEENEERRANSKVEKEYKQFHGLATEKLPKKKNFILDQTKSAAPVSGRNSQNSNHQLQDHDILKAQYYNDQTDSLYFKKARIDTDRNRASVDNIIFPSKDQFRTETHTPRAQNMKRAVSSNIFDNQVNIYTNTGISNSNINLSKKKQPKEFEGRQQQSSRSSERAASGRK